MRLAMACGQWTMRGNTTVCVCVCARVSLSVHVLQSHHPPRLAAYAGIAAESLHLFLGGQDQGVHSQHSLPVLNVVLDTLEWGATPAAASFNVPNMVWYMSQVT